MADLDATVKRARLRASPSAPQVQDGAGCRVRGEVDPALRLLPRDQFERIMDYASGDIGLEFLGFTEIYFSLASIIPSYWTILDLGCAYAPQAFIFKDHKAYIGVDRHEGERFTAPNTTHYRLSIGEFIAQHGATLDQDTTFAICSYVPPWGEDGIELARRSFKNVFTYYPARDPAHESIAKHFAKLAREQAAERDTEEQVRDIRRASPSSSVSPVGEEGKEN